jgi:hypothetical protein
MMKKETEAPVSIESGEADEGAIGSNEFLISAFASKLGEEVGEKFSCYLYREYKDDSGRAKKTFLFKFPGIEPDPMEIAEKYRGGKYHFQFIWKEGKAQRSKGFTLEIDAQAFPPIDKNALAFPLAATSPNMSESMQLQLAMVQGITRAMEAGFAQGSNRVQSPAAVDPTEMFSSMLENMMDSFQRVNKIQQSVMERVVQRNMESTYGLEDQRQLSGSPSQEEGGLIEKYAPIVKEIIDGIKSITSLFGEKVPKTVVAQVRSNDRFHQVLRDPRAIMVIGSALRREFGDEKTNQYLKTFGIRMENRPGITPNIPSMEVPQASPRVPPVPAAASGSKVNPRARKVTSAVPK